MHRGKIPNTAEMCRITVEDNGIGFDSQHQERVFGIFQRLHPRDVYEGQASGWPSAERSPSTTTAAFPPTERWAKGPSSRSLLPVVQRKTKG